MITITESGKATSFVGATDANGAYSIDVRMRYADEEPKQLGCQTRICYSKE